MSALILTEENLAQVKRDILPYLPDVKSSHISEALASSLGYGTHAALLKQMTLRASDPEILCLNEATFLSRLKALGLPHPKKIPIDIFDCVRSRGNQAIIKTCGKNWASISYKTPRSRAWRNLMVAATNAGIEQKLFSVRKDDNRWPGADNPNDRTDYVYRFECFGFPAVGYVGDAGFGELAIHAAINPPPRGDNNVRAGNAGFYAGEAFGNTWLERDIGAYIQTSTSAFRIRKSVLAVLADGNIEPKGYGDRGKVIM